MSEVEERRSPDAAANATLRIDPSASAVVTRGGVGVRFPTRRAELAIVVLASAGEEGVDTVALCGLLWPDAAPDRARNNLRTLLWQARKALGTGPDCIARRGNRIVCTCPVDPFDGSAVEAHVEEWRQAR